MKKIPTVFERDWERRSKPLVPIVHPGCEWVLAGEGIATRKLDGTCCMVRANKLYKRRELRKGEVAPPDFERADHDDETGKTVGWVPVGDGPDDRWHCEAFARGGHIDGTYELVGPKVQRDPEQYGYHCLVPHDPTRLRLVGGGPSRTFDGLRDYMRGKDIEGIVFHHPDGRMAKIKLRDFGLKRGAAWTPSPADLRKLADEFDGRLWNSIDRVNFQLASAALRFQAAEIEREAYRIQQQEREWREPRPLHTGREM